MKYNNNTNEVHKTKIETKLIKNRKQIDIQYGVDLSWIVLVDDLLTTKRLKCKKEQDKILTTLNKTTN